LVTFGLAGEGPRVVLRTDAFLGAPRVRDGRIAWVQWGTDRTPCDGTQLWLADYRDGQVSSVRRIAGGDDESVLEPQWDPAGGLTFVSELCGWWNLYRWDRHSVAPLVPLHGLVAADGAVVVGEMWRAPAGAAGRRRAAGAVEW
jgi:hypothetical protein